MKTFFAFALMAIGLSGCNTTCDGTGKCFKERWSPEAKYTEDAKEFHKLMSGSTSKSYDRRHGTQYEYFAPNGRTYLVYPGNKYVLPGFWKIEQKKSSTRICFLYPSNSYNPVTREYGGDWECQRGTSYLLRRNEVRKGDLLRLAKTTKLPKVLPKKINLSIETAMKEVGYKNKLTPNRACEWKSRCRK
ncbi:hypothetical protein PSE_3077 [Pseudovibrio sp. FO-BEG1]|uniref:hypothetical protein n=1 Tax=Pseudovibrio sp. (strain FO-BEG1) TaxID=911045 RepID=UPI000238D3B5|nr:hypothetical protein [Pseudovibrio sp. FO-BEG1]AEV37585.1 hypothetical protein PSE_3077 [Pseudovibrio sp. FO-BEG1]